MSEEQSFFGQIKGQLIAGVGVVITAIGGIVISQVEGLLGVEEEPAPVEQVQQQPVMPTIVINNENNQTANKDTVVKKVYVKPKPKLTETEKRKKEFDW